MELAIFGVTALVSIACAVAMIISSNAVHSALFLVLNFSAVAVLYLLLQAPFLAMIQITVYAGAIMVLFLFVLMLLGSEKGAEDRDRLPWQRPLAWVLGLLLLGEGLFVMLNSDTSTTPVERAGELGNPRAIAPLCSPEGLGAHPQSEWPTRRTTINQRESAVAAFV